MEIISQKSNETALYAIKLLKSALSGIPTPEPDEGLDFDLLYRILDAHSVTNIAYLSLSKLKEQGVPRIVIPDEVKENYYMCIAKEANQQYETEILKERFEQEGIKYCILKGWFLKEYYASPDLRTMCDIDVLITEPDFDRCHKLMLESGFEVKHLSRIDNGYYKYPAVGFEIHRTLIGRSDELIFNYYTDIWERLEKVEDNQFEYRMKLEDFYVYMIVHIYKHFVVGGIGIRAIMDIFVFLRAVKDRLDFKYIESELAKIRLCGFNKAMTRLSLEWFSPDYNIRPLDMVGSYIVLSSTYGNTAYSVNSHMTNNTRKEDGSFENPGRIKYVYRVIFPKFFRYQYLYPSIKNRKYLVPFYWLHMWFTRFFIARDVSIFRTLIRLKHVDQKEIELLQDIKKQAGIEE